VNNHPKVQTLFALFFCPQQILVDAYSNPTSSNLKQMDTSYLVEWAIALHGKYESALVFVSISK